MAHRTKKAKTTKTSSKRTTKTAKRVTKKLKKELHRSEARRQMNKNLKAKYEQLKRLLTEADSKDVLKRYEVGVAVLEVTSLPRKYGQGAVRALAAALGLDQNTLYDWSTVAKKFTLGQVKKLIERRNKYGLPLSFWHLCILARVSDKKRHEAIEATLGEGLSVRDLQLRFPAGDHGSKPAATFEAGLGQFLRATDALVTRQSQWTAAVFKAIVNAKPDRYSNDLLKKLRTADDMNGRLEKAVEENRENIKASIKAVEDALKKPLKATA